MKSRLTLALTLLIAFSLGLASFHPIAVAMEQLSATTCSTTNACIVAHNTADGPGIGAFSKQGIGVLGTTGVRSNIAPFLGAGVAGIDRATSQNTVGVLGESIGGNGMIGISKRGLGVGGLTNSGDFAIEGIDTAGQTLINRIRFMRPPLMVLYSSRARVRRDRSMSTAQAIFRSRV